MSPWPAPALKKIEAETVGILGTSLSAIDALITVSTAHGAFYRIPAANCSISMPWAANDCMLP